MISESKDQSFNLQIASYTAKHIAAATGCSLPTAYDWKSGRRKPVKWIQARYIEDISNHKPRTTMPESEDLTRYTAPPDNPPEQPTYLLSQILRHVENWAPNPYNYHHTIDEVRDILKESIANLIDEDNGIDTI